MRVERRQRGCRLWIAIALCCFVLSGCSDALSASVPATLKPIALQPARRPTSTLIATLPPDTPQPIDDALDVVSRALSAGDASKLTSLLLEQGRIIFHLHRYNTQGQEDALNGQWRIDAILYQ